MVLVAKGCMFADLFMMTYNIFLLVKEDMGFVMIMPFYTNRINYDISIEKKILNFFSLLETF